MFVSICIFLRKMNKINHTLCILFYYTFHSINVNQSIIWLSWHKMRKSNYSFVNSCLHLISMWHYLSIHFIFQSVEFSVLFHSPVVELTTRVQSKLSVPQRLVTKKERERKSLLQVHADNFIFFFTCIHWLLTLILACLLLPRSFKEAGICLKNYAFKCMEDEARIKTGLILSGISAVGGAFCGSQKDKEGQ